MSIWLLVFLLTIAIASPVNPRIIEDSNLRPPQDIQDADSEILNDDLVAELQHPNEPPIHPFNDNWYKGELWDDQYVREGSKGFNPHMFIFHELRIFSPISHYLVHLKSAVKFYFLDVSKRQENNPEPANMETTKADIFTSFRIEDYPALPEDVKEAVKKNYKHGFGIIIHGWEDKKDSVFKINKEGWMAATAIDWMNFGKKSILYVDWSSITVEYFIMTTQIAAGTIAEAVMIVIELIIEECGIMEKGIQALATFLKNIHIAGHSMGAQIAGLIGHLIFKKYELKLGIIFGLDPAGPQFKDKILQKEQFRLNEKNALFVQVLHSDMKGVGNPDILGHADHYAQGGVRQPDCDRAITRHECNHMRSVYLFRASMYLEARGFQYIGKTGSRTLPYIETEHRVDYFGIHTRGIHGIFFMPTTTFPPYFNYNIHMVTVPRYKAVFSVTGKHSDVNRIRIKWDEVDAVTPLAVV